MTDEKALAQALAKRESGIPLGRGVIAIQAADHKLLRACPVDVALNIASMQEMDPSDISAYFDDLRAIASHRQLALYCCNREQKRLPDGEVTRFAEYPWCSNDKIVVDELCPWHQQYYVCRPPAYRLYDGPIRHRLVTF